MKKRQIKFYIVDVFGDLKYSGNQLAVFPEAESVPEEEMQQIAREINFSETTFITKRNNSDREYNVRIFTPGKEVPFAGHPTLGTAFIIQHEFLQYSHINLSLLVKAGKIPVVYTDGIFRMEQIQPEFGRIIEQNKLQEILQLGKNDFRNDFPIQIVSTGLPFILVPLKTLDALKRAKVDRTLLKKHLSESNVKEIMVFSPESYNNKDSLSTRVFVEEFGIPEDPATGSANGCLAAYLVKYKFFNQPFIDLSVGQGYEIGRPSQLFLKASVENDIYQINVGGKVGLVAEGIWY